MSKSPAVVARNLTVKYGASLALEDVALEIPAGRITAIVGPSGCGKSTFLTCLNRLSDTVPGCTVSGELVVGNVNVLDPRLDVVQLRRRVGLIFQRPNPFPMSIRRNIEMPLREHGLSDADQLSSRTETVLRQVGLWNEVKDRLESSALALSGGQQQRLCLARALALEPEILLLDEPCSALDPPSSEVVEELMLSLQGRYTLVVVTHNLAQARRVADHVLVFWWRDGAGRLIESGSREDVFGQASDATAAAYLQGRKG